MIFQVDGFIYVSQVLLTMKGKFIRNEIYKQEYLQLLQLIFQTINIAMRFEPANAKFFHDEVCKSCLCDLIRCLGCFSTTNVCSVREATIQTISIESQDKFYNIFIGNAVQSKWVILYQTGLCRKILFVTNFLLIIFVFVSPFSIEIFQNFSIPVDIPVPLFYSTIIYRHLYDLALDLYDKPNSGVLSIKSPSLSRQSSCEPQVNTKIHYR